MTHFDAGYSITDLLNAYQRALQGRQLPLITEEQALRRAPQELLADLFSKSLKTTKANKLFSLGAPLGSTSSA